MTKTINFAPYLSENIHNVGYVRKILAVEELENQEDDHHYGTISKSHYYSEKEREAVPCEEGDFFVISTTRQDSNFNLYLFTYYLVQVNFDAKENLRLLGCACRIGGYDAAEFPRPEHIFVETLLTRGWFKSEAEQDENRERKEPEKEPHKTYRKTCPFCKTKHEQSNWLNILCPCGAKYYFHEEYWLNRKTGEKKANK